MKLKDYLREKKIPVMEFAKQNDIWYPTVFYWIKGTHRPNKFYQHLLNKITKGKVTEEDWK